MPQKLFTVCIVGRPNVGKSTLFNKLTGSRRAIVDDMPGVTRDRLFGKADLNGIPALIIDTGGIEMALDDTISAQVRQQAMVAVEEADAILFVVDGLTGPTPVDLQIVQTLRHSAKPIVVAVNKLDTPKKENLMAEFYELGFDKTVAVSAEHSIGLWELADALTHGVAAPPPEPEEPVAGRPFTVAVVGRPNVGKSSLINRIIGEKRLMVSDIAGTTRDSIDTAVKWHGQEFTFIDTAGIRRKNRVSLKIEKFSIVMALKSIERAELALLVLDATQGITVQDERVAGLINEEMRACVIVVNKWDLLEKDTLSTTRFERDLGEKLKFMAWAPVVFVSAETGQRLHKIFEAIALVRDEYRKHVDTGPLNRKLATWVAKQPPPIARGHRVKFYYVSQAKTTPPTFTFVVSRTGLVAEPYERYLVNRIREEYGFTGAPVRCAYIPRTGRHEIETPMERPKRSSKPKEKQKEKTHGPKKGKRERRKR
ncbi:MAG: ribosome biogenesis GTPase Der [Nitrospinae bacterium]|nr:ribosome biogenesis GTPase Der [Nitrospinota bacterium]